MNKALRFSLLFGIILILFTACSSTEESKLQVDETDQLIETEEIEDVEEETDEREIEKEESNQESLTTELDKKIKEDNEKQKRNLNQTSQSSQANKNKVANKTKNLVKTKEKAAQKKASKVSSSNSVSQSKSNKLSKPSKPEKPNKPSKPEKPNKPSKPEKPSKPNKPSKPEKPTIIKDSLVLSESIDFETITKKNDKLPLGKKIVEQKGKKGKLEKYFIVTLTNGKETNREFITDKVVTKPVNELVVMGTMASEEITEEVKVKYETVEKDDPTLPIGQTKVKQEGKDGLNKNTVKVSYKDGKESNREVIKSEVITKPVDKIVLVGTKEPVITTETEERTEVVPFEKEIEYDPTLEKGQTKIKQVGKNGERTVVIEITYKDGVEDSRKEISSEVTSEPVSEITLVGTKPVITTEEVTVDKEIKFKTIKENDPTLPKGETKVKQAGKNGLEKEVYVVTYEDGKEVSREHVRTDKVSEPVDKIVLIGTKEPVIETKTITETKTLNFKTVKENDPTLPKGETKVKQDGKNGVETTTIEITYTDGKETSRKVVKTEVTTKPVNKIILVGTKEPEENNHEGDISVGYSEINKHRESEGRAALRIDADIQRIAQLRADKLAELNNGITHNIPGYGNLGKHLIDEGHGGLRAFENITAGTSRPIRAVQNWKESPNHNSNMLNHRVHRIGLGYKNGIWVLIVIENDIYN